MYISQGIHNGNNVLQIRQRILVNFPFCSWQAAQHQVINVLACNEDVTKVARGIQLIKNSLLLKGTPNKTSAAKKNFHFQGAITPLYRCGWRLLTKIFHTALAPSPACTALSWHGKASNGREATSGMVDAVLTMLSLWVEDAAH
jgi:hypothetical protein